MANLPSPKSTASFWHSEPSPFLLDHRTTAELPKHADVVIVGSGITGASAARFLAEDARASGMSIVMLEARQACWGATGRNGGHCQPLLFDSTPEVAGFEMKNYQAIESYVKKHQIPCEWRSRPGCRTFWTENLANAAKNQVQNLKDCAPELGREVTLIEDQEELAREYKVDGAVAAMITTTAASLWPYKLIAFILEKLVLEGRLNLQTLTPVTKIDACEGRPCLHTSRGTISARHVILATNAYTSHLLPEFADLIVPERGIMTALLPPKGSKPLETSYAFVGAFGSEPTHDDYLIQRPFSGVPNPLGHLMFGGGRKSANLRAIGETDDSVLDEGSAAYLRETLTKLLKLRAETDGTGELTATHQWSGIWGTSKDCHPWVGAVPNRHGVWLTGGYSGHGMPNGTLCGKAVIEMLLGEETGAPGDYVEEKLVKTGNLPQAYLISKERMENCKRIESVAVQAYWRSDGSLATRAVPIPKTIPKTHALQDYQIQLMLLEKQKQKRDEKLRVKLESKASVAPPSANVGWAVPIPKTIPKTHALQDYQIQLMLLEKQKQKRDEKLRVKLESKASVAPPSANVGSAAPIPKTHGHARQDYEMQLMLLEQQNKKRLLYTRCEADATFKAVAPKGGETHGHARQDYEMQLMLLEQQNKKRLLSARCEADATFKAVAPKGGESSAQQNHQMHVMLQDHRNKKRLLSVRYDADATFESDDNLTMKGTSQHVAAYKPEKSRIPDRENSALQDDPTQLKILQQQSDERME